MYIIKLKNGKEFIAGEGQNIFEAAKGSDILLPHSCLAGRCSSCKTKLIEGKTQSIVEEQGLKDSEKEDGFILSCIRRPKSDIKIDIQDLSGLPTLPDPKTIPVKINAIRPLTNNVIELELRKPPSLNFEFIPGQYVNLIRGGIKRSYSIASLKKDRIVFYIKNYPGGKFSSYLFNQAKEGDLMRMHGPFGTFMLREEEVSDIVFLATGTGIAPVRNILENMSDEVLQRTRIHVFHGVRKQEDSYFDPKEVVEKVHFYPCLSQEEVDDCFTGYVQDILLNQQIQLRKASIYACGSNLMINDAFAQTTSNGLDPNQFYSDAFVVSS